MTAKPKPRDEMTPEERAIWAKFDAEIQKGIDAANSGKFVDADEFFDELIAKYQAMSKHRG
jgi:predicted transcriptional regulator